MNSFLNPYINFAGNARQAMEFYQSVFGGELAITTFGDMNTPDASADGVMHAALTVDGKTLLMGSDGMDQSGEHKGFSVSLGGTDADELRGYFAKLSNGGDVALALSPQQWGDEFGMVTDQFGIYWMVNITAATATA